MPSRNGAPAKLVVVWSLAAQTALDKSLAHIGAQDHHASELVRRRLLAALAAIVLQPGIGTRTRRPGTRRFPIPKTGHVIEYQVSASTITISRWARQNRVRML
jgi:plasmid stabilization system protein ParE